MNQGFKNTPKQDELMKMLAGPSRYDMALGGSRSGKTFGLCKAVVIRASKVKSRHAILRLKFNHAKTSLWMDTLPKVFSLAFPGLVGPDAWNKTDYCVTLPNGSEIWVGGLDDQQRVEKILGKEYSTIYFNECSQIPYKSIQIALTRLAEKNELKKKAYFDMNPPGKKHWSYWLFIKKIDPQDNVPVDPVKYASILMNPTDNLDNIDSEYVSEVLSNLPEAQRKRFMSGEFATDDDGAAYYAFDRERHVKEIDSKYMLGQKHIGMDFNVNPMTAVIARHVNNNFVIYSEEFLENSDTYKMSTKLMKSGHGGATIYPDSTGKNRKTSGISDHTILKSDGFTVHPTFNPLVVDRINNINRLFREDRIIIDSSCKKLIADLEKVSWKDGALDKKTDPMITHISDALGYLCWALDPLEPEQEESSVIQL